MTMFIILATAAAVLFLFTVIFGERVRGSRHDSSPDWGTDLSVWNDGGTAHHNDTSSSHSHSHDHGGSFDSGSSGDGGGCDAGGCDGGSGSD